MHMATYETIIEKTLPNIKRLHDTLRQKSSEFMSVTENWPNTSNGRYSVNAGSGVQWFCNATAERNGGSLR